MIYRVLSICFESIYPVLCITGICISPEAAVVMSLLSSVWGGFFN